MRLTYLDLSWVAQQGRYANPHHRGTLAGKHCGAQQPPRRSPHLSIVNMLMSFLLTRPCMRLLAWMLFPCLAAGCFSARGIQEIKSHPFTLVYEDDATTRFGDTEDTVFIEVRTAPIPRPLENLAVHYSSLFPGGEAVRPGDAEEYLKIDGHTAYKVVFRPAHIRQRKRVTDDRQIKDMPPGWTEKTIEDPVTGEPIQALYGPVIPRQKILYLVEGKKFVYYVFLRADGESIEPARKKFEDFVSKGIRYL